MGGMCQANGAEGVRIVLSDEVSAWRQRLANLDELLNETESDCSDLDHQRLAAVEALERLKSAAAAAQARITAAFTASQLAAAECAGCDVAQARRSAAGQVALARHDSPVRGGRHVGLACALVREMPHTLEAMRAGDLSEWRATLIARETACLTREHRAAVDLELSGRMGGWGDQRCAREARAAAYRLDPVGVVERLSRATSDRRVSIRPAPDTMTYLTGLLPVAQGVAAWAALQRQADALRATGDPRSRGQIMADELVARVTGSAAEGASCAVDVPDLPQPDEPGSVHDDEVDEDVEDGKEHEDAEEAAPEARLPRGVGVEIQLIMTDSALFGLDDQPAMLTGFGPLPAATARDLIRNVTGQASTDPASVWVRRLYTDRTGRLVAMDSRRRAFPPAARRFLLARDQTCRTPWCDAPIRHADHVTQASLGGPTSIANGQGVCENCNYIHAAPGWTARPGPGGTVHLTTPTGDNFSTAPPSLHPPDIVVDLRFPPRDWPEIHYAAA